MDANWHPLGYGKETSTSKNSLAQDFVLVLCRLGLRRLRSQPGKDETQPHKLWDAIARHDVSIPAGFKTIHDVAQPNKCAQLAYLS